MTSPGRGVQVVGYRRVLTGGVRVDPAVAGPTAARARLFWPALVVETLGLVDGCGAPLASLAVDRGTVVPFADLDLEARRLLDSLPDVFARFAHLDRLH